MSDFEETATVSLVPLTVEKRLPYSYTAAPCSHHRSRYSSYSIAITVSAPNGGSYAYCRYPEVQVKVIKQYSSRCYNTGLRSATNAVQLTIARARVPILTDVAPLGSRVFSEMRLSSAEADESDDDGRLCAHYDDFAVMQLSYRMRQ
eukprot:4520372-Pleurochrysis_carterae.AAC.1